eukprot:SAG31_NODE_219_length_19926_cov_4.297297_13_plen_124_part_00
MAAGNHVKNQLEFREVLLTIHGARMFWTLNGSILRELNLAPTKKAGQLKAAIGLSSINDAVAINYGTKQQSWPFVFDLSSITLQPESIGQHCLVAGAPITLNVPESKRSYSSIFNGDPAGAPG